jgi:hypothetical protein
MSAGRFPRIKSRSPGRMANHNVGGCVMRRRVPGVVITALLMCERTILDCGECMRLSLVIDDEFY